MCGATLFKDVQMDKDIYCNLLNYLLQFIILNYFRLFKLGVFFEFYKIIKER